MVEAIVDTDQNGTYRLTLFTKSDFSPADAPNGTFDLAGSANGEPELGFIKTANTSGTVEVHLDTYRGSNTYSRFLDATSDFSPADAANGTFELAGSANGQPELGFIKTANTSGTVEVHLDAYSNGSYHRVLDATSDFSPADAGNGTFELVGSANGEPELGFIKTANTSGTVEVHLDAYSNGSYHRVLDATSDFSPADAPNGTFELVGSANGQPELGFIKTANTSSQTVEVHLDAYSNGSYHRFLDATSQNGRFAPTLGTFELFG